MTVSVQDQVGLVIGIVVHVMDTAVVRGDTLKICIRSIMVTVSTLAMIFHSMIMWMMVVSLHRGLLRTTTDTRPDHVINSD